MTAMKIMFIYSHDDVQSILKPIRTWSDIQFGISYISSALKANNHQTKLVVLGCNNKWEDNKQLIKSSIEEFDPDIIGFTATYSQYSFIEKTAQFTKNKWPEKFHIIGGVHASLNPNEVIKGPFDALCIGEGEYSTLELCKQLETKKIPHEIANLWIKSSNGEIENNETNDFIQELDVLAFPDRDMWKPWVKEQLDAEVSVLLGRGCPYNCTYCSNHALRKLAGGKYTRFRSPENILQEVASIHKNYSFKNIYFEIESICINKSWVLELCSQLEVFNAKIDNSIRYACNFRVSPQSVDEEIFSAFQKANFYKINIGLESGSEKIRKEVLKRNYSNEDFLTTVSMARKHKLQVYLYNMIGLPGESLSSHMETVALNRQCQPDGHYTGIFVPYPGTEIYDTCIEKGLMKNKIDARMERKQVAIESPDFSKSQIKHAYIWFDYRVYKGYKPLWIIFVKVMVKKIRANSTTNLLFRRIVQLPILRNIRAKLAKS